MTWCYLRILTLLLVMNWRVTVASHGAKDDTLSKLEQVTPLVGWSMDSYSNTTLFHEYNTEEKWDGDLATLDSNHSRLFRPGVVNKAICIANKQFSIARNLTRGDCVRDPMKCTSGIIATFWIRIISWKTGKIQKILDTSDGVNSTGVTVQIGRDSDIVAMLRTSNNKFYEASIALADIRNSWTQIGLAWDNQDNTLEFYCNGTKLRDDRYKQTPHSGAADIVSGPILTDFTIGDVTDSDFCMDELRIYDESLQHMTSTDLVIYSLATTPAPGNALSRAQIIILTTLVPMLFVLLVFLFICLYLRRKRRIVSLLNYTNQTTVVFAPEDDADLRSEGSHNDDDTDVDTDHEIEKLNNRLLDDYGAGEV